MARRLLLTRTILPTLSRHPVILPRNTVLSMASVTAPKSSALSNRRLHGSTQPVPEFIQCHEKIVSPLNTKNFIDNQFVESKAEVWIDLNDPATNNLVTRVPQSTEAELKAAVDSAAKASPAWKATSLLTRQQIMFRFVALIRQHWDRLAASITLEQGKTFNDAKGDVLRGLQVAEVCRPSRVLFLLGSMRDG